MVRSTVFLKIMRYLSPILRFMIASIAFAALYTFCYPREGACESRFIENPDGTVKDTLTDLVWIKDPEKVPTLAGAMLWMKARACCQNLSYGGAGAGAWYLPNIKELQSLLEEGTRSPRIDSNYFDCYPAAYWSATDDTGSGPRVWTLNFANGELSSQPKLSLLNPVYLRVRCVRRA